MSRTIHVENISPSTSEKELRDFFSFCGAINSLKFAPATGDEKASRSASVTFEKEQAARTALMLDNTNLGSNAVKVTAAQSLDQLSSAKAAAGDAAGTAGTADESELTQEDKPVMRIFAEYLAHGYVITDTVIEKGIAVDKQHGFSSKFTNVLKKFDAKVGATENVRAVDEKLDVTGKGATAWQSISSYFEKAMETGVGQKLRGLYTEGNKQVTDVHNEAKHLASIMKNKESEKTTDKCEADCGKSACCEGSKSARKGCAKNPDVSGTVPSAAVESPAPGVVSK